MSKEKELDIHIPTSLANSDLFKNTAHSLNGVHSPNQHNGKKLILEYLESMAERVETAPVMSFDLAKEKDARRYDEVIEFMRAMISLVQEQELLDDCWGFLAKLCYFRLKMQESQAEKDAFQASIATFQGRIF